MVTGCDGARPLPRPRLRPQLPHPSGADRRAGRGLRGIDRRDPETHDRHNTIRSRTAARDCRSARCASAASIPIFRRRRSPRSAALTGAAATRRGADARPARAALVLDRQRRLARSRSVVGGRGAAGRRRQACSSRSPTSTRPCRRVAGRSARRAEHDVGLHARRDLSDAAGAAVDRSHVAQRARGSAGDRHRVRRVAGRRRCRRRTSTARWSATTRSSPTTPSARGSTRRRSAAAGGRRGAGHGRAAAHAGRRRAGARRACAHEHGALDFETIEVRARVRRRHAARSAAAGAEPREGADREPDDRGQRRDRAVSRRARLSVAAPRRQVARALGSHPRARRARLGDDAAGRGRLDGAGGVPGAAQGRRTRRRFPICRATSSSCSARASTWSIRRARSRRGTSASRCATTRIRRRRTGAIRISITQRLVKAALAGHAVAVRRSASSSSWRRTARSRKTRPTRSSGRCASRRRRSSCESRIGETFDAHRHRRVEQRHVGARDGAADRRQAACSGDRGLDVGDRVRVRLAGVDVERGFIDFERA